MKKLLAVYILLVLFISSAAAQKYSIRQYLSIRTAGSPTLSPDGRRLAYLTNVTGTAQVWVLELPGIDPRQVTNFEDNVAFVRWLPDNSGLIFGKARGGDENSQLYFIKPDGTGVRALTNEPNIRHNFDEISADGRSIYYTSNKRDRNFSIFM